MSNVNAEISRLTAMVEQMVTRDHVGECVEAAVAEERAKYEAFERLTRHHLNEFTAACNRADAAEFALADVQPIVDAAVAWLNDDPKTYLLFGKQETRLAETVRAYQHAQQLKSIDVQEPATSSLGSNEKCWCLEVGMQHCPVHNPGAYG